jgi:hypothetical protein
VITTYWVLRFVITILNGEKAHFPVDGQYSTQESCEADLPEWDELIQSQFPDDPNTRVYCEEFSSVDAKGI